MLQTIITVNKKFCIGKLAIHNTRIDYKQRYDDWQKKFQHDENGNVIMHTTRTGKQEATLVNGARIPFDKDRPSGSVENGTDMDHTVSAGEIIRDPAANAHLTKAWMHLSMLHFLHKRSLVTVPLATSRWLRHFEGLDNCQILLLPSPLLLPKNLPLHLSHIRI